MKLRPVGYLVMLLTGLAFAVGVEWIAVHTLKRWTYSELMPRVPGLEIGIVPVIQNVDSAAADFLDRISIS